MEKKKKKKKLYQRMWFWIILTLLVIGTFRWFTSEPADYDGNAPRSDVEYTEITVDELAEEFSSNELRAKDTYLDSYVSVTGRLRIIDEDGEYFELYPMGYDSFDNVHCILYHDDQREKLKEYSKDDTVTVKGKITELGDFYELRLQVDCIE